MQKARPLSARSLSPVRVPQPPCRPRHRKTLSRRRHSIRRPLTHLSKTSVLRKLLAEQSGKGSRECKGESTGTGAGATAGSTKAAAVAEFSKTLAKDHTIAGTRYAVPGTVLAALDVCGLFFLLFIFTGLSRCENVSWASFHLPFSLI